MTAPSSKPSPETSSNSNQLSDLEWDYVDQIAVMLGCVTDHEQNSDHEARVYVQKVLDEAQQKGLDPRQIYQVVAAESQMIAQRLPKWDDVAPSPS